MSAGSIFIVDDDRKTAASIRLYLEAAGFSVETFHDGSDALDRLRHARPLAVILDVMLPGADGLAICRELRRTESVPILIVSARTEEADRLVGLSVGADDYITKPFSPRELVARVQAVLRRSGAPLLRGLAVDVRAQHATVDGRIVSLTATEFRVLHLLVSAPGRVFTRYQLIRFALGEDFAGFDRTVDVHIKNIRRKLRKAGGQEQAIVTVFGVGYKLAVE